jgi:predicted nucleic acid-binding Zn ribbon protein
MKERGPEALSEILGQMFVSRGWSRLGEKLKLEAAWAAAAGEEVAKQTRVSSLKRGVLEIEVRSSVLQQELAQFLKRTLLKAVREKLPHPPVNDLKFRSGSW